MASEESEPGDLAADPDALLDRLQESGWERNVLATLLETDDDAKEVMRGALPSINGFELHLSVGALMQWVERQRPGLARQRKAMAQRAGQPRLVRDDPPKDPGEVFEALLAENIELARTTYRSKYKQALQREGAVPAEVEELETRRWALALAKLIKEAQLPAVEIADNTADPCGTWIRLCGNRRARTLRSAARTWGKFSEWLGLAFNEAWPC